MLPERPLYIDGWLSSVNSLEMGKVQWTCRVSLMQRRCSGLPIIHCDKDQFLLQGAKYYNNFKDHLGHWYWKIEGTQICFGARFFSWFCVCFVFCFVLFCFVLFCFVLFFLVFSFPNICYTSVIEISQHFQGSFGPLVLTFCGPLPNFEGNWPNGPALFQPLSS